MLFGIKNLTEKTNPNGAIKSFVLGLPRKRTQTKPLNPLDLGYTARTNPKVVVSRIGRSKGSRCAEG